MTLRDATYRFSQWRHARPKRAKDSSFRVLPAVEIIARRLAARVGDLKIVDIGPRNLSEVHALETLGHVDAVDLFPTSDRIRRGDMHALPCADDAYDVAFLSHVLEHARSVEQAVRQIARVVKPGGCVWIAVPTGFVPSRHDRICFRSTAEITMVFSAWSPEVLYAGATDHDLRVLLKLWKEPKSARKTVLLALTRAIHVRNMVAGGLIPHLVAQGLHVVLLVPKALRPVVTDQLAGMASAVTLEDVDPMLGSWWRQRLRAGLFRTASYVSRERGSETYRHKLSLRRGLWQRFEIAALRLVRCVADPERLASMAERLILPALATRDAVRRHAPAVVVVPSFIQTGDEVELLKVARRAAIPSLVPVASWDNLVSKGGFLVRPDKLAVWGPASQTHAAAYHGFLEYDAVVTGSPHLDVYSGTSLDRPHSLVLVAGTTVQYWRDEDKIVTDLHWALGPETIVHHRRHPRTGGTMMSTPTDLLVLRGLLDSACCVVTAFSTVAIEGALLGKPALIVGFGGSSIGHGGILEHSRFEHMREVLTWDGVMLCRTMDELRENVLRCVKKRPTYPALMMKAATVAANVGRAGETLAKLVREMADADRR